MWKYSSKFPKTKDELLQMIKDGQIHWSKRVKVPEKQTKNCPQNFKTCFVYAISSWDLKDQRANRVDPDEAAHDELPHLALLCLQMFKSFHFFI